MQSICIDKISKKGKLSSAFLMKELPMLEPAEGQVLVKVHCAALNVDDVKIAEGWFYPIPGTAAKPTKEKPYVPGHDFSGEVVKLGPNVKNLKVGDRVFGLAQTGSWSQYCLADASMTGIIPTHWTYEKAVSYVMGAAVVEAISKKLGNLSGKRILVVGASGSVGNIAVQHFVQSKASVWAVCSGRNEDAMLDLGVEKVIDYTVAPFDRQIKSMKEKVDFVVDMIGGTKVEKGAYRVLRKGGKFVTVAGPIDFSEDIAISYMGFLGCAGRVMRRSMTPAVFGPKYYMALMDFKQDFSTPPLGDKINPLIDSVYQFNRQDVAKAIDKVMSHRAVGKVLVKFVSE